jgi:hypothetical protein
VEEEGLEAAAAVECQADHSVDRRCHRNNNTRRLEHLLSLQHRQRIALHLNQPSIRVWVVGEVAQLPVEM